MRAGQAVTIQGAPSFTYAISNPRRIGESSSRKPILEFAQGIDAKDRPENFTELRSVMPFVSVVFAFDCHTQLERARR